MHAVVPIISIGWAVFWIGWLAAAVGNKPGRSPWGRYAGIRLILAAVVVVVLRGRGFRGHGAIDNPWLEGIGLALFVLGLALAVWARVYIGRNWGVPMTQKVDPELITSGPYRTIRHPIYSGIILAMIGTALAISPYVYVIAAALGASFIYSAVAEERYMTTQFPDAYPAYKASTKMLIPFIF
jgi:protein-S-isoprenylcysteine O-methyltransferase Ste14